MTDKEVFYWSNISDMLAEVKEIEMQGKIPKKYNLRAKHFTFYDTYINAMKLLKYIKSETFETRIMHKVNDKGLKRRLAISHRKVGKLFDGLLASFGGESELLERDFTNRLQEIEKEIEQEREAQANGEVNTNSTSKWTWGK